MSARKTGLSESASLQAHRSTVLASQGSAGKRKYRTFPAHTVQEALAVAQKIRDENAANPMNRLLLGDALDVSPSSSNFRDLLSSSFKYGLTDGTEKAT